MKLSPHFSLSEFTKSQSAIRNEIDNDPTKPDLARLKCLCTQVLEKIRYGWGPVTINSGYRSEWLNDFIGGSETSQHCLGEAADIEVMRCDNREVAKWIKAMINFDQLILEYYKKGEPRSGWIHISYRKDHNRNQVLRAIKRRGKTVYLKGL